MVPKMFASPFCTLGWGLGYHWLQHLLAASHFPLQLFPLQATVISSLSHHSSKVTGYVSVVTSLFP